VVDTESAPVEDEPAEDLAPEDYLDEGFPDSAAEQEAATGDHEAMAVTRHGDRVREQRQRRQYYPPEKSAADKAAADKRKQALAQQLACRNCKGYGHATEDCHKPKAAARPPRAHNIGAAEPTVSFEAASSEHPSAGFMALVADVGVFEAEANYKSATHNACVCESVSGFDASNVTFPSVDVSSVQDLLPVSADVATREFSEEPSVPEHLVETCATDEMYGKVVVDIGCLR